MAAGSDTAVSINYDERIKRLRSRLRRKRIDAILISRPENRRYLSGYRAPDHGINETSGLLFIPARGGAQLLTDFRYRLQAEEETSLPVTLYKKGLLALLNDLLGENTVRRFAFESHYTLHSFSVKLATLAEKHTIELVPVTDLLRRSTALNEAVFSYIYKRISGDMTEIETAAAIESRMRQSGAEGPSFSTIVASGENGALPHAVPTEKVIGKDQGVTIDMGLVLDGYCSDMTRNFVVGTADETYTRIHRTVRRAQLAGIEAVKPGRQMKEVDRAARKVIADSGYGKYFGHALGHGVGLAVHEAPSLSFRSRRKLKPGMIVTIEPGIYIPGWGGVRLENLAVVREDGCEVLNRDTTYLDI